MSSKRETILAAIKALLLAVPQTPAASNVFRSRQAAIASTDLPAIVVRPGGSDDPQEGTIGPVNRFCEIEVGVYMEGAEPDSLADPTVVAAHGKIMADRTLAGLAIDIVEGSTRFAFDRGDKDSVEVTLTFTVHYRTAANNLAA